MGKPMPEYLKLLRDITEQSEWSEEFKQGCMHIIGCCEMNLVEYDDWNEAVEASAKVVDQCNREGPYNAICAAPRIRELKK